MRGAGSDGPTETGGSARPRPPREDVPEDHVFIGGEWRRGSGRQIELIYPASGDIVGVQTLAGVDDAAEAIDRARVAQQRPEWSEALPHERAAVLHRISDGIRGSAKRISRIQTTDTGKTLAETEALALSAAGTFRYMAAVLETLDEDITARRGDSMTLSLHQPMGVIGAITPWNSPIASDAQKVAPALAAGNAVVLKPATWAPMTSLELARICQEAGLPDGLLSVLPGDGSDVGDLLVRHPDVAKVSFTGGTSTGLRVAAAAAEKLMPVSLELGGKSPTIVFEDADIDHAVAGVLFGIFSSSGQSCIAGSRLFVQRSIRERFMDRLLAATERLRTGDPTDPRTQVGPLVHEDHRVSVAGFVEGAVADGGRVLTGGRAPEDERLAGGSFYLPTIIDQVEPDSTICRDEVFGPVLVALDFTDERDLVHQANDSVYGLACGIWTSDYRRALRMARAIDAGTVWVNTYKQFSISTPFGGLKLSGTGREKGRRGVLEYMNQKSVYLGLREDPHPWADLPQAARSET